MNGPVLNILSVEGADAVVLATHLGQRTMHGRSLFPDADFLIFSAEQAWQPRHGAAFARTRSVSRVPNSKLHSSVTRGLQALLW